MSAEGPHGHKRFGLDAGPRGDLSLNRSPDVRGSPEAPLLEIAGLEMRFGGLRAIRRVDLAVRRGAIHAIIGPNGAGKTTVFNCIAGFVRPSAGRIWLGGERIDGLPVHRVAAHGVARTYQNIRLFRNMSVIDNVLVGEHRRLEAGSWQAVLRTRRFRDEEEAARGRARDLLDLVGIRAVPESAARSLSYGDQRRLEIARALATRPGLLMLDEPAAGMNPTEADTLVHLIKRIHDVMGTTILLIEHHMRVVMRISDTVTVLDQGAVLAQGPPEAVRNDDRVVSAYLGVQSQPRERRPETTAPR